MGFRTPVACLLAFCFWAVVNASGNPTSCPDIEGREKADAAGTRPRMAARSILALNTKQLSMSVRTNSFDDVCSSFRVNPCGTGTCLNEDTGRYSCACDEGFVLGADISGQQVCVAAGSGKGGIVFTVRPGDTCASVAQAFHLSIGTLQDLNNNGLDCTATPSLIPGQVLTVRDISNVPPTAPVLGCGQAVLASEGDTCESVRARYKVSDSTEQFLAYNPGLQCADSLATSQQVCIRGALTDSSAGNKILCGGVYDVVQGDTCCAIAQAHNINIIDLLELNPGIKCDRLLPEQEMCVSHGNPLEWANCNLYYYVQSGDTCPSIWAHFGISGSTFLALNPGIQCSALQVGQRVCVG